MDQERQPDKKNVPAKRAVHAEARRLLAAALKRIPPQIGAPGSPGAPGAPESPREGHDRVAEGVERVEPRSGSGGTQEDAEPRPRWRRMFGG